MPRPRSLLLAWILVAGCGGGDHAPPPSAAEAAGMTGDSVAGHAAVADAPAGGSSGGGAAGSSGAPASPSAGGSGAMMAMNTTGGPATVQPGSCCPDGQCLCHGDAPAALSGDPGPYTPMSYDLTGVGCIYYPTDAQPPFAAVAIADGFGGSGGCDSVQVGQWGPLYASHGIAAMIVDTGSGAQPDARGDVLLRSIAALEAENERNDGPLYGKLAGRYGTSGFSMGGGGSSYASSADPTLSTSVSIMPWGVAADGGKVPTLVICGASDGVEPCSAYGAKLYAGIDASVPKMRVTIASDANGQPSADNGNSGAYALAFQKVFLEGDQRWRALLVGAKSDETTIK
jgi:dienelactone hydrolase